MHLLVCNNNRYLAYIVTTEHLWESSAFVKSIIFLKYGCSDSLTDVLWVVGCKVWFGLGLSTLFLLFFPLFYSLIPKIVPYYSWNYSLLSETFLYINTIYTHSTQILESTFVILSMAAINTYTYSTIAVPYIVQGVHSIAHYAQLSQVWLHVAVSSTLSLEIGLIYTPLFPNYYSFISTPIIPKEIPE